MVNIDKTAMLTGWLMGRKVAGMMKLQEPPAEWETIFDGEATTVLGGVSSEAYSGVKLDNPPPGTTDLIGLYSGKTYRITFAGAVYVGVCGKLTEASYCLGNLHLYNTKYDDSGEDFGFRTFGAISIFFYTRTPGTYKLKIEKQVTT